MTVSYAPTTETKAPVRMYMELWEGNTLIEKSSEIAFLINSGIQLGGLNLKSLRYITPTSNTHVKFYGHTGAIGTFNWPLISKITPKYGVGTESAVVQAAPTKPTFLQFTYAAATKTYSVQLQSTSRTSLIYMDPLESSGFLASQKRINIDVNMTTYVRTASYTTLSTTLYPVNNTSGNGAISNFTFKYPSFGFYSSEFATKDYEGKQSSFVNKHIKENAYRAPTAVLATNDPLLKKVSFSWVTPTQHADGTALDPVLFKGYLIYLRNFTTKATVYAYKTLGYTTNTYVTPNSPAAGNYDVLVCGWSTSLAEGTCAVTGQLTVN